MKFTFIIAHFFKMSKITIFVALLALASIASANNQQEEVSPSRWHNAVMAVHKKVDRIIDAGISHVTRIVEKAKQRVDKMSEKLKMITEKFGQRVYDKMNKLMERADQKMKEITDNITAGVDVSECKKLRSELRYNALAAVSNMSTCIVEKLELGGGYIDNISQISDDILFNLTSIKEEAYRCSDNVKGIKSAAAAIVCSNVAAGKATWVTIKSVPKVTTNIAKLTFHLTTLPVTLPYCVASHGYTALRQQCSDFVKKVKMCVREKMNHDNGADVKVDVSTDVNETEQEEDVFNSTEFEFNEDAETTTLAYESSADPEDVEVAAVAEVPEEVQETDDSSPSSPN